MHFDKAAETYAANSFLQKYTAHRLISFLQAKSAPSDIIELGCGTGHLTMRINELYPISTVYTLDIAPNMLQKCAKNLPNSKNLFCGYNAEELQTKKKVDLLISNMTMQWFRNLEAFLGRIYTLAKQIAIALPVHNSLSSWSELYCNLNLKSPLLALPNNEAISNILQRQFPQLYTETEMVSNFFNNTVSFARQIKKLGAYQHDNKRDFRNLYKVLKHNPGPIEVQYQIAYFIASS